METNLLTGFNTYLNGLNLSRVSIANYLADVKKFLQWIGNSPLHPTCFRDYLQFLIQNLTPASSLKRYRSSLKLFGRFLEMEEICLETINPDNMSAKPESIHKLADDFGKSLMSEKLAKATVVNYMSDVRQFISWLEKHND